MAPILATHALTKRYGATLALDRLDLSLEAGALFGFLGPNGAGKTTTLRLLLGLLRPTSGRAAILGHDCWRDSVPIRRDLGYLPGELHLYPNMTGLDHLKLFGRIRGISLVDRGRALAEQFDLDLARRAGQLSRGNRQKLGLVLALAHEPRLMILDEPTGGLDPMMQDRLRRILRAFASRGHTIVFSSHQLDEVEQLCDRVAILREGRLVEDTDLESLRRRAPREVRILWGAGVQPAAVPPALELVSRDSSRWLCRWHGPSKPLLGWLAGLNGVEDVTISPPDLESLFHEYYRT